MADIPPSYGAAVSRDPWPSVDNLINFDQDLYNFALVSKSWNSRYTRLLWEHPWFKLGQDEADIRYSFTIFMKCLAITRPSVRSWTQSVTTPISLSEIEVDLAINWIYSCLSLLPNLKVFSIPGLKVVDGESLSSFRTNSLRNNRSGYPLRVLNVSYCRNIVSTQLSSILPLLRNLTYLDLSRCHSIKAETLIGCCSATLLPDLRILKLCDVQLSDAIFEELVTSLGTRVWCLDVRDNFLTDKAISDLLDYCFLPPEYNDSCIGSQRFSRSSVKEDDEEWHVRNCLSVWGTLWPIVDMNVSGITHLYTSGNLVSIKSLKSLLLSERLKVLDFGIPRQVDVKTNQGEDRESMSMIRAMLESVPSSPSNLWRNLSWLRLDFEIILTISSLSDINMDNWIYQVASNLSSLDRLILILSPAVTKNGLSLQYMRGLIRALATFHNQQTNQQMRELPRLVTRSTNEKNFFRDVPTHQLQEIVLELTTENRPRLYNAQDDVNDKDVTAFTDKLHDDFSFFENEKERLGSTVSPTVLSSQTTQKGHVDRVTTSSAHAVDFVRDLAAFRRSCEEARFKATGTQEDGDASGYWPGKITISRSPTIFDPTPNRRQWRPGVSTRWG
ncbi:MAG: hypothetical protein M1814_004733 [Vezdaea aestivalis]|nr:MAG: hypothetical protein M1814_004733 [Vezdaea aestivalis]